MVGVLAYAGGVHIARPAQQRLLVHGRARGFSRKGFGIVRDFVPEVDREWRTLQPPMLKSRYGGVEMNL